MLSATIESFEQKFGPISSYLDFDTIQYCIDIGSDIIIDNNNHGCLNILFCYYALLDDNLDHLRTLLKLEGTSRIYFNFHFQNNSAIDPKYIQKLWDKKRYAALKLLLQEKECYRSIRPVLSTKQINFLLYS